MSLLRRFRTDDPVPVTVGWSRPAPDVIRALGAALQAEYLATAKGGRRFVYRLVGGTEGRNVSMRVSVSATHVGTWPNLSVTGEVRDAGPGSEFKGSILMPGVASRTWVLVLAALAVLGVLLPMSGLGPWAMLMWLFCVVAIVLGPDIRRRNLRRYARDIEAILATVGDGREGLQIR